MKHALDYCIDLGEFWALLPHDNKIGMDVLLRDGQISCVGSMKANDLAFFVKRVTADQMRNGLTSTQWNNLERLITIAIKETEKCQTPPKP